MTRSGNLEFVIYISVLHAFLPRPCDARTVAAAADPGARMRLDSRFHHRKGSTVIIDHRTYDILPGRLKDYVGLYETKGWPMQKKHLGNCIGWYTSNDIGELNQIVHMWAYESLDDRARRRAAAWRPHAQSETSGLTTRRAFAKIWRCSSCPFSCAPRCPCRCCDSGSFRTHQTLGVCQSLENFTH